MTVQFIVNGVNATLNVAPTKRLVDILREDIGIEGLRSGCRKGSCGACSLIMDGAVVRACLVPAFAARDREIITIEGLEGTESRAIIIDAFKSASYYPCDFCFAQKVLSTHALLEHNPSPDAKTIEAALHIDGCLRCGGSSMISAVQAAAARMQGSKNGRY